MCEAQGSFLSNHTPYKKTKQTQQGQHWYYSGLRSKLQLWAELPLHFDTQHFNPIVLCCCCLISFEFLFLLFICSCSEVQAGLQFTCNLSGHHITFSFNPCLICKVTLICSKWLFLLIKKMRKYVWDHSKYVCPEELHLIDKHSLSLGERKRKGHF